MTVKTPEKILVPVELTELSGPVLEYAYFLAKTYDAELHVLHVWEPPRYIGYDVMVNAGDHTQKLIEAIEDEARIGLEELIKRVPPPDGLKMETRLESGFAANVIVDTSADDYDVIVMGTHGRSGLRHLLVGSVAERTARFATVPVVIVPTKAE